MQRHGTLTYIENTITGNLDKQQQSMATNWAPVMWRKDNKQSSSTSAQKRQSAKQAPVLWHKSGKASTSTLAQKRQSKFKHQYLGTKAAKQSPVFGTKATNQEPVLSTFCIHTNTFTGSLLSLFLVSSNENLGIKYVSCGLKRSKKFLPSGKLLSLTFVFHFTLFTLTYTYLTLANDILFVTFLIYLSVDIMSLT